MIESTHKFKIGESQNLSFIEASSVDLVVTSPPYPMVEMWDDIFSQQNPKIKSELEHSRGTEAWELMNVELDKVWSELYRVLKPGGIACINIGDATRTLDKNFQLYSNHA